MTTLSQSAPALTLSASKFEVNLEALRGYAALFVVWNHAFWNPYHLDPAYSLTGVWAYDPPGHLSVLIFFVLSGYVIGLTNATPLMTSTILPYLKKRLVRLYPIYLVCLGGALLIAASTCTIPQVLSHLVFGQVLLSPTLYELGPSWSLHYEILSYLLFIPLSYFRLWLTLVMFFATIGGLLICYAYPVFNFPILSSYLYGFSFWTCGVILARRCVRPIRVKASASFLVSILLLVLCIEHFNILRLLMLWSRLYLVYPQSVNWEWIALDSMDYTLLPYCLLFILFFINKDFFFKKLFLYGLYLAPMLAMLVIAKKATVTTSSQHLLPVLFYVLSILLFFIKHSQVERICRWIIEKGIYLGSISYALYLVHMPVHALLEQIPYCSGSGPTYVIRFLLLLSLSIMLAHALEKKFQPWVKHLLT